MNGIRKILDRVIILFILLFSGFSLLGNSPKPYFLEQKALLYFCQNVKDINKNLIDFNVRFNGKTTGKPSSLFNIADCLGDICLIKDSIPNKNELDSLSKANKHKTYPVVSIGYPINCEFLKKHVFAPFNKRIYTLYVFNAVKYNESYYVELFLKNKNRSTWVVCIKFDESKNPVNHCSSFIVF